MVKKLAHLETVLDELKTKQFVTSEDCDLLISIDTPNKDTKKKISRFFFLIIKNKNILLHLENLHFALICPRAYSYVRKTFNSCLPHPSTLRSWYKSIEGSPGFTTKSFHCIKVLANRDQAKGRALFCVVIIEKMAIRKHVQWDGKKCVGFINFGEALESDSVRVA